MAMFRMDIGDIIHHVVCGMHAGKNSEQAAGLKAEDYLRLGKPTKALYLAFDVRSSCFQKQKGMLDQEARAARSLHFLFHRTHGSIGFCSTHTFAAVDDNPFAHIESIKEWKFLSSHDSCWKDAAGDFASAVYFQMAEEVNALAGFTKDEGPAPKDLSWNVWFQRFDTTEFYQWVNVQVNRDPNDKHGYEELITVL